MNLVKDHTSNRYPITALSYYPTIGVPGQSKRHRQVHKQKHNIYALLCVYATYLQDDILFTCSDFEETSAGREYIKKIE